jgi:hypothetical protein
LQRSKCFCIDKNCNCFLATLSKPVKIASTTKNPPSLNTQIDTIENLGTEANDISDTLDVKLDTNAVTASAEVFADFFHDSWDIMVDASMNMNPGDLAKVLVSAAESVSNGMDKKHDLGY